MGLICFARLHFLFLLLRLIFFLLLQCSNACPPNEDIAPFCSCESLHEDVFFTCRNILCPEQLIGPIRAVADHQVKIYSLAIEKSSLMYIPDGIFKDTFIEKISFDATEIMSLTDTDVAFSGLEDALTEIRVTNAPYVAQWDFQHIRHLRHLKRIDIHSMTLEAVNDPFPHLPELTALGIIRAKISYIVDYAFSNLTQLTIFNMMENDIENVKRNMFPDPAQKLVIIDLSYNSLENLPEDYFSNMPSLIEVHLDHNKFQTIQEDPFRNAFGILHELTMTGNPFRCDCRMQWLISLRKPYRFVAYCEKPDSLHNILIRNLEAKSVWCLQ